MKRILFASLAICLSVLGAAAGVAVVNALDTMPLSEAHVERIRTHCVEAGVSLNQLHASDGLMRVNRGQLYESISTKLMAPLNSRLVLNRIDTQNLLPLASEYNRQLQEFRSAYQQYEVAMTRVIAIDDCTKQPETFYTNLADARAKRERTYEANKDLQDTIINFGAEFDEFAKKYSEGKS